MRRPDLPPTKSNLLRLKEAFRFVSSGYELLDQKRQVLLEDLVALSRQAAELRREAEAGLAQAYAAYQEAVLVGGDAEMAAAALAPMGMTAVQVRERSAMGVVLPLLEPTAEVLPQPVCAPGWSPPATSRVRQRMWDTLPLLVRLAEAEVSCRRLAAELIRTQRKVNALEQVFIPEYRDTIHFIESVLEEKEREALFQLKLLKHRREQAAEDDTDG